MKTYITQLTERTPEQLEEFKWELFFNWASKSSYNITDLQFLITNKKLYNWFNNQMAMLESEFIQSVANNKLFAKSKHELYGLYIIKLAKVKSIYPKRILDAARKPFKKVKPNYSSYCAN